MTKNVKILLGIGFGIAAYWLYTNHKRETHSSMMGRSARQKTYKDRVKESGVLLVK